MKSIKKIQKKKSRVQSTRRLRSDKDKKDKVMDKALIKQWNKKTKFKKKRIR